MTDYRISDGAGHRLDDIYVYPRDTWGEVQAQVYLRGMFARFEAIAAHEFPWRPIPADYGVTGWMYRYQKHFIYWKLLQDGTVGIVTILHERMHRDRRLLEDWRWEDD